MSANLFALLGHRLSPADLLALPQTLRADVSPELARAIRALDEALSAGSRQSDTDQPWRMWVLQSGGAPVIDPDVVWAAGKIILVRHPAESADLYMCRRSCVFSAGLVWRTFLESTELQARVHDVCAALARLLGSPAAIYLPSQYAVSSATNLVYEGRSLAEVAAWLREHHGPPGTRIDGRAWESNSYFIDTFAPPEGRAP